MKQQVLIIDDDESIREMVSYIVEGLGGRTTKVTSGDEMFRALDKEVPDLVVLDLGLPDENGLVLARQFRARSNKPIIVLTGDQTSESLIAALEIGVDDFVTKPFVPYELQLRIRNVLKRTSRNTKPSINSLPSKIAFGDLVLDADECTLKTNDEAPVHLTPSEFAILHALIRNPSRVLSRSAILDVIAKGDDSPSLRAVDVYIRQLRKKIEADPKNPEFIISVRGIGYRFSGKLRTHKQ